jgi:hypothetical protein
MTVLSLIYFFLILLYLYIVAPQRTQGKCMDGYRVHGKYTKYPFNLWYIVYLCINLT